MIHFVKEKIMKYIVPFCLIACWPVAASAQSFVNPDTIYKSGDIYIQNTDVYYNPFAPDTSDTRGSLSNEAPQLLDPNGVGFYSTFYQPMVHGTPLAQWAPHGTPIGPYACWQRLFTARDKQDQSLPSRHSDIIAGDSVTSDTAQTHGYGEVTISKNDDVDFRASGTIKLESGFHAMPGCSFHAYIEPRWDTTVFSDEFDDTAKFNNQWIKRNGNGWGWDTTNPVTYSDSNVRLVPDTDAHDGHALDVILREVLPDTALSIVTAYGLMDTCNGTVLLDSLRKPDTVKRIFSTTRLQTCPFPYTSTQQPLGGPAYAHMPYGKYEVRDKVPHVLHHTNNWGGDGDLEWDLNETWGGTMGVYQPDWGHRLSFGPCHGYFARCWDRVNLDTVWAFISHDDTNMVTTGYATGIIIDNIVYSVVGWNFVKDTFEASSPTTLQGGFPASLINSGKTYTFYYQRWNQLSSSLATWHVSQDGSSWCKFRAPYRVLGPGDSLFFSKSYQPTSVYLTHLDSTGHFVQNSFPCYWDHSFNSGSDTGYLHLENPLDSTDIHSFTQQYLFNLPEAGSQGCFYPVPGVLVDRDTNGADTAGQAAYATEPYRYHTYTMEFLPHEVRFLYDSNVVRRFPDRMIPPGDPHYDWVSTCPRGEQLIYPSEIDMDGDNTYTLSNLERKFFEQYDTTASGCWDVIIGGKTYHAAHHLIDYVKVWDVPKEMQIPDFLQ